MMSAVHGGPPAECGDPRNTLPLFRAWSARLKDHFYTTNETEMNNSISSLGYTYEGITGYILPIKEITTVPLYRLYQACQYDHFYTVDKAEADNAVNKYGYTAEGIAGYVYPPQNSTCGGVPLYRLYSVTAADHFYTTSETERDNASKGNYTQEGIAAYIFPF